MMNARWIALLALLAACTNGQPQAALSTTAPIVNTPAPNLLPTSTRTPPASLTRTLTPAPSPAPVLRQLTTGGCCVQPFWSPHGSQVWFIDRPTPNSPSGIWGVDALGERAAPQFVTDRLGVYSPDGSLLAYPERGQTYVERVGGERWVAPSEGRAISFSPDSRLIAWQVASSSANFDRRLVEVWVAQVDGSGARRAAQLLGGGVSGWFPDGERLLVSGRESASADSFLAALSLSDGSLTHIARGARLRGAALSPQGGWLVYQVTFSGDPAYDGLWVVGTLVPVLSRPGQGGTAQADGSGARRLPVFGAYRWRSEGKLLVIPLESAEGSASHRLLEVDVASGEARALTDPALTPFRVAGGDWAPSPDGSRIVFVSDADHNLWVIDLPP